MLALHAEVTSIQGYIMTVRSRLKLLIAERNLERIRSGHAELSLRQIASDSRLPPSVLSGLTRGQASRVDLKTLDKLCRYFQVQPGDLLEYIPDESSQGEP